MAPLILPRACSTLSSLQRYNSAARKSLEKPYIKAKQIQRSKARSVSSLMLSSLEVSIFHVCWPNKRWIIYVDLDPRTACAWQSYVNDQDSMSKDYRDAMAKLAVLGQDSSNMIDCSEVIPEPKPLPAANSQSVFPPGFTNADVDQAVPFLFCCAERFTDHRVCQCASTPFPHLPTNSGQPTPIAPV